MHVQDPNATCFIGPNLNWNVVEQLSLGYLQLITRRRAKYPCAWVLDLLIIFRLGDHGQTSQRSVKGNGILIRIEYWKQSNKYVACLWRQAHSVSVDARSVQNVRLISLIGAHASQKPSGALVCGCLARIVHLNMKYLSLALWLICWLVQAQACKSQNKSAVD